MKYLLSIFFLSVLTLFCLGKPPLKPNDHSNKPFTSNLISPIYHNPKINSKEIITVRHGTTYAMEELKIQGDLDTKEYRLNDLGKKESKRVANQLKEKHSNIHTIISCNKKRCIETAAQIHTKFSSASV